MSSSTLGAYKAEHLKKKGDAEVRKENYRDAIKHYSEALEVRSYGFVVAREQKQQDNPLCRWHPTRYSSFFVLCSSLSFS